MRRREGDLLDFGKVVLRILVERELPYPAKRHILLRPDLGQVEDIPAELLGLLGSKDLNVNCPARIFTALDCLEEILGVPVGVFRRHFAGFFVVESLATLVGLAMDLDIDKRAVRLGELISMARVTIHISVRVRSASVREQVPISSR